MAHRLALFAALAATSSAAAQPVAFKLVNSVPAGKKPTLTVTAAERVVDLRLDLTRAEGGAPVAARAAALKPGQSITFSIGDGAAGVSHYKGAFRAVVSGQGPWESELTFETAVVAELKITYRRDHLDLDRNLLEFQASRPIASARVTVIGEDGQEIGSGEASLAGRAAGEWLPIAWKQRPGNVMKLLLRAADADGIATNVTLTPWSVAIPHEEVSFASGSAVIEPSERPKLDAAYAKIVAAADKAKPFVRCLLFIAGHTDTVGGKEANHRLSVDRARAIAVYFRGKGLGIPISYEGFGEDLPRVKTPDETEERANRRADYVLAAEEPLSKGDKAQWKPVQ